MIIALTYFIEAFVKKKLVIASWYHQITLLCFLPLVDGGAQTIKCYQCFSNKSWDDCDRVRKVVSCFVDEQESCGKSVLTGKRGDQTIKVYAKLCLGETSCVADGCAEKIPDQSIRITNCDGTFCCSKDLCNGAKAPIVSSIILLACALQAVLR